MFIQPRFGHSFEFAQPSAEARQALEDVANPRVINRSERPITVKLTDNLPGPGDVSAEVSSPDLASATAKLVDVARRFGIPFSFKPDAVKPAAQLLQELGDSLKPAIAERKQAFTTAGHDAKRVSDAEQALNLSHQNGLLIIRTGRNNDLSRWLSYITDGIQSKQRPVPGWEMTFDQNLYYQGIQVLIHNF